jgi:hypothetical protein
MNCRALLFFVVPGLDQGIHSSGSAEFGTVDPRVKPEGDNKKPEGDKQKQLARHVAYEEAS